MEQENKKLKISIFDVIIVAAVLIAAFAVFLILKPSEVQIAAPETTPVQYVVELVQVPEGMPDLIQNGDAIKDSARNYDIGKVVSYEVAPFTTRAPDEENNIVRNAELDRYCNILLTIQADMLTGDGAMTTASGYKVTVGTKVFVSGPSYAGTGYVTAIDREAAE